MRPYIIVILIGAIVLSLIAIWLNSPTPFQPEPDPPPLLQQLPKAYWAEAAGTIRLSDDMIVPGKVRLDYLVYPDNRVVIPNLIVWMGDIDLVVTFLWWEAKREPLRCTSFRNESPIEGVLQAGEIVIPAGAKVAGQSFFKRGSGGVCKGKARVFNVESPQELRIEHDPAGNHFALTATFETNDGDNELTVGLDAQGNYLNRPPVVQLEVQGRDVVTAEDGCPVTSKGKPPIALANTPEGLFVTLKSTSYDPDGKWPAGINPKRPRVDLSFEQWARSRPGKFEFLGAAQEIGPVLFETGREHQLLLWVTDRKGAEARKLCHFQVVEPN